MATSRRRKADNDIEVLPPEALTVRIDAAYLTLIATNARRLQVDPLMDTVLKKLKKDAAFGLMSTVITLDMEGWRAAALLIEIEDRLTALGFQTKKVMKEAEGRWPSSDQPALHVVWGGER